MKTTAKEIMSTDPLHATDAMTLEDALKVFVNARITGLPVLDQEKKLVGVMSEYDILVHISKAKSMKPEVFQESITFSPGVDSIHEDTPIDEVMTRFVDSKFRRLPVVDATGKLVGIISRRDLMRVFYYRASLS